MEKFNNKKSKYQTIAFILALHRYFFMKKYNYLTKRSKIIAIILAFLFGLVTACYFNTTFFQVKMKGTWHIVLDNGVADPMEGIDSDKVIITSNTVKIGNKSKIKVKFRGKSKFSKVERIDSEGKIYYFFYEGYNPRIKYGLIYDKKNPTTMILTICDDSNLNNESIYYLEKQVK